MHIDFWRELQDDNPDIMKLQMMGTLITSTIEDVQSQFKKLSEINQNNIRALENYGYFLSNVVNDEMEDAKIFEKLDYVKNSVIVNK